MLASSRRRVFATYAAGYQALRRKPALTGVAGAPLKGELPRVLTLYWFPWRGAGRDAA